MFLDIEADRVAQYVGLQAAHDAAALVDDAAAACAMVEDIVGPIARRTVTERVWSTGRYAALSYPAASVTSVEALADPSALQLIGSGLEGSLPIGRVLVEYEAGYLPADVPEWAKAAAKLLTKWLWQARQPPKASNTQTDLKARADALLAPHAIGARP